MGSVIRSKEKLIVNEEIPNKFFYQTEKQKQTNKTKHLKPIMTS